MLLYCFPVLPEPVIDEVYYLQNYAEGWTEFENKVDVRECIHNPYHFVSRRLKKLYFE